MSSPAPHRTPRGNRDDDAPTPRRRRSAGGQTPRGHRTPARDDPPTPSRTPRRNQPTPARSDTIDTPMRWGGARRDLDGDPGEIPSSPAQSMGAASPGNRSSYF